MKLICKFYVMHLVQNIIAHNFPKPFGKLSKFNGNNSPFYLSNWILGIFPNLFGKHLNLSWNNSPLVFQMNLGKLLVLNVKYFSIPILNWFGQISSFMPWLSSLLFTLKVYICLVVTLSDFSPEDCKFNSLKCRIFY